MIGTFVYLLAHGTTSLLTHWDDILLPQILTRWDSIKIKHFHVKDNTFDGIGIFHKIWEISPSAEWSRIHFALYAECTVNIPSSPGSHFQVSFSPIFSWTDWILCNSNAHNYCSHTKNSLLDPTELMFTSSLSFGSNHHHLLLPWEPLTSPPSPCHHLPSTWNQHLVSLSMQEPPPWNKHGSHHHHHASFFSLNKASPPPMEVKNDDPAPPLKATTTTHEQKHSKNEVKTTSPTSFFISDAFGPLFRTISTPLEPLWHPQQNIGVGSPFFAAATFSGVFRSTSATNGKTDYTMMILVARGQKP